MRNTSRTTLAAIVAIAIAAIVTIHAGATSMRPPAQPTAVATVDIAAIINGLEERKVLEDQLNARRETRKGQLEAVAKELEILEADIKMLEPGTDEQRDKLAQYMERKAAADARLNALSRITSIDLGNVMRGLYGEIEDAIARISEREGYDVVLMDDSAFPLPENAPDTDVYRSIVTKGVIWRHDSIDITDQVITLMNNEFTAP